MIISDSKITHIITHYVGNRLRDEGYSLSLEKSDISDLSEEYYLTYFLSLLKSEEKYRFSHPTDIEQNEIYILAKSIFEDGGNFLEASQDIAKLLYAHSEHPKINEGKLHVVTFSDLGYSGRQCQAVGIFKSETDVPFLKIEKASTNYTLSHETGYELNGLDKGALIIDNGSNEHEILIFDKNGIRNDSKFWIDDFLQLELISNEFYQTTEVMKATREFIKSTVTEEFEISKPDQMDLLNRSMDYLKNSEIYDKNEFLESVMPNEQLQRSFRSFTDDHLSEMNVPESFPISEIALKKMSRSFKSVLKLDKNFHVYIHGDRNKIEKGVDENGRKYYKIYFDKEN